MFESNNKLDVAWLSQVHFFQCFSGDELTEIAALGQKVVADPGALLTDQGRYGDVSYVIVEGTANVSMNGTYVASVGPGSVVGEMALVEHRPRAASVTAETEMTLVSFGIEEFRALLDRSPTAKEQVLALLDARSRANLARQSEGDADS